MRKSKKECKHWCDSERLCSSCDAVWNNMLWTLWQLSLECREEEYLSYPLEVREEAKRTSTKWL